MNLEKFNLREFLKRIAWKRTIAITAIITLAYNYSANEHFQNFIQNKLNIYSESISRTIHRMNNTICGMDGNLFDIGLFAITFIAILGLIRLLKQRPK